MTPNPYAIKQRASNLLIERSLSWSYLAAHSEQIIAYGSVVFGLDRDSSDLDLLCIGKGKEIRSSNLDLNWIDPLDCVYGSDWLESELATHVARYGIWLLGLSNWRFNTKITSLTRGYKIKSIIERILGTDKRERFLDESYRTTHAVRVRRDLQRLVLLTSNQPVIATSILDYTWQNEEQKFNSISKMFMRGNFPSDISDKGMKQLSNYNHISFVNTPPTWLVSQIQNWLHKHVKPLHSYAWSEIPWKALLAN